MNVSIVYVYPASGAYDNYAERFVFSYYNNVPNIDHRSIVMINGGSPNSYLAAFFGCMKNLELIPHDNSGYDIGAFQKAAMAVPSDLMVFFGTTAWIKGKGWLERMVASFEKHGDHLFGSMGNQGGLGVHPHIRTTGFWMRPGLFNTYPHKVTNPQQRYPFEHGSNCLTQYVWSIGRKAFVVTWNAEYEFPTWDSIRNGYHRGDQSACLVGDRVSDPPYHPIP